MITLKKTIFFIILLSSINIFSQVSNLFITPSIDGCVYLNNLKGEILLVDKVYSDVELKENITFTNENMSKYDVFDLNENRKYQYFLIEKISKDSSGVFNTSEGVSINLKEPVLNNDWDLIDFNYINFLNYIFFEGCSDEMEGQNCNELIVLKNNFKLLIIFNKDSNSKFKLVSNKCGLLYDEIFDENDIKISLFSKDLFFMHSGHSLYIIKILDNK